MKNGLSYSNKNHRRLQLIAKTTKYRSYRAIRNAEGKIIGHKLLGFLRPVAGPWKTYFGEAPTPKQIQSDGIPSHIVDKKKGKRKARNRVAAQSRKNNRS